MIKQNMEGFKKLLYNNLILALLVSLPFDAALFLSVSKFRIKEVGRFDFANKDKVFYWDLDHDGFSEKVLFQENVLGNVCLKIFNPSHQGQFNSQCKLSIAESIKSTGDVNRDGMDEILFLGERDSAVYLNVFDYRTRKISEILVDSLAAYGTNDYFAGINTVVDADLDGFNEVLVYLSSGFSLQPRALYLIEPATGEKRVTPFQGSILTGNQVFNIDEDPYPEIIVGTFAYRNQPENVPNTDSCSWLIVFDHNLQYEFEPIKISCSKSQFSAYPIVSGGVPRIFGVCDVIDSKEVPNRLLLFSGKGEKISDIPFEKGDPDAEFKVRVFPRDDNHEMLYLRYDGHLFRITQDLKLKSLKKRRTLAGSSVLGMDMDRDGNTEWLFKKNNLLEWVVTDSHFKHPVKLAVNGNPEYLSFTHKLNGTLKPTLFIQSGSNGYEMLYGINPWWYGQVGLYVAIWIFFLVLVTIISRIQKAKFRQQALLQEQMNELQYRVITSQFSPHYTFNVLNAISAKLYGTYPELYDYINRFSRQLRYLYAGRNELQRTIREEIEFCRDYLEIQKLRFSGKFDFTLNISEEVSQETIIPKMLVFTFVENALKHGLRDMESGGHITISAEKSGDIILLKVTDNGNGMDAARDYLKENPHYSTGKGLELLENLVQQMNRTGKGNISWQMKDRKESGHSGTEVTITLEL